MNEFRMDLEHHFAKIFELIYLKNRCEPDKKRNITKGISIIEEIMANHHKICKERGVLDHIKLEFEIQINELNDEILSFKAKFINFY